MSGDRPRNGTVVDKRAKHARRSCDADASLGSQPWECRHHPGQHHRRDQFAGDEQAGWAAGVDWRRNAQGCPGWRGWRSRWRRSRSICGASRRQGRHRARRRLGACRRLTLWYTRSPGRVIRAGSLLTHGRSCLIGDDIYPGAQLSRLMASPERSSDDDDNTPCLGPSRSVRALASGRGNAATKVKSMPTALHYSSGRALPTRLVSTRRPIFTFRRMEPVARRRRCQCAPLPPLPTRPLGRRRRPRSSRCTRPPPSTTRAAARCPPASSRLAAPSLRVVPGGGSFLLVCCCTPP